MAVAEFTAKPSRLLFITSALDRRSHTAPNPDPSTRATHFTHGVGIYLRLQLLRRSSASPHATPPTASRRSTVAQCPPPHALYIDSSSLYASHSLSLALMNHSAHPLAHHLPPLDLVFQHPFLSAILCQLRTEIDNLSVELPPTGHSKTNSPDSRHPARGAVCPVPPA